MPVDPFFTSSWKRAPGAAKKAMVAAVHRRSWPAGSQFAAKVKLEMREAGGAWWHFLNVPGDQVEDELEKWAANNPAHEFRVAEEV